MVKIFIHRENVVRKTAAYKTLQGFFITMVILMREANLFKKALYREKKRIHSIF